VGATVSAVIVGSAFIGFSSTFAIVGFLAANAIS
jgi:hypothetical protein